MCSPLAIGSRHANCTIWARCRGGNLDRMPRARHLGQDTLQPRLFIAPTQPPDRGRIALHLKDHGLDALAIGDGQHRPCSLDLEPRQSATACNLFEDRLIVSGQQKTTWFSTSHEQSPRLLALSLGLIVAAPNFLQNLWPGTLVLLLISNARSSVSMFFEPSAHFV